MSSILDSLVQQHPRVLLDAASFESLGGKIKVDPLRKRLLAHLRRQAETLAALGPLEDVREGGRLIFISRKALHRILLWALLGKAEGNKAYIQRAEKEMVALASFQDWNPKDFLDTAEMTAALALGYDWLYDDLEPEAKVAIREAIIEKGLKASFQPMELEGGELGEIKPGQPGWWVSGLTNWTQVCHGGLVLGALAVAEDAPELASLVLERATKNISRAAEVYEPSGVYPEGVSYWAYGTTYHALLIAAVRSALGRDFGLENCPGLYKSLWFIAEMEGPFGEYFNYADNKAKQPVEPAFFWLAGKSPWPGLAAYHREKLEFALRESEAAGSIYTSGRFDALLLPWAAPPSSPAPDLPQNWFGRSIRPIAVHRSAWNDHDAVFIGIKGGMPDGCHGHMDEGTFVLDADGVRWIDDLGQPNYLHYEMQGIDIWNLKSTNGRWSVLANGPRIHNIFTVGDVFQDPHAMVPISRFSETEACSILDLSASLPGRVTKALRGIQLRQDRRVVLQDEIEGAAPGLGVRWAVITRAEVRLEKNRARLHRLGKTLDIDFQASCPFELEITEVDSLRAPYDMAYPEYRLLIAGLAVPPNGRLHLQTVFTPESATAVDPISWKSFDEWPDC